MGPITNSAEWFRVQWRKTLQAHDVALPMFRSGDLALRTGTAPRPVDVSSDYIAALEGEVAALRRLVAEHDAMGPSRAAASSHAPAAEAVPS